MSAESAPVIHPAQRVQTVRVDKLAFRLQLVMEFSGPILGENSAIRINSLIVNWNASLKQSII